METARIDLILVSSTNMYVNISKGVYIIYASKTFTVVRVHPSLIYSRNFLTLPLNMIDSLYRAESGDFYNKVEIMNA